VLLAADLELDVADLLVLLDPRGYIPIVRLLSSFAAQVPRLSFRAPIHYSGSIRGLSKRTGSVLPTADLDELEHAVSRANLDNSTIQINPTYLLDISDLTRHFGGMYRGYGGVEERSTVRRDVLVGFGNFGGFFF
jgi:hypothetical protein